MGLGNTPNAAEAFEPEDEEELYNCGAFGPETPDSLLSTVWTEGFTCQMAQNISRAHFVK